MSYAKPDVPNRRDAMIIAHVFRNFITLSSVVHDLFFSNLSTDTSRKVLRRLVDKGYLTKFELFGNLKYFRLGSTAATRWGYPGSRTHKLGAQRLPYELGTLAYTCLDEHPHKRLLRHELKSQFPWFPEALMQWAYILEQDKLGSIRVETRARPSNVIRKLSLQLYRYSDVPEFRTLIEQQQFFIVCVTATEHQEIALQQEAADQSFPVKLRTANYPELIRFI